MKKIFIASLLLFTVNAHAETVSVDIPNGRVAALIEALEALKGQAPASVTTNAEKIEYYIKELLKEAYRKGDREKRVKQILRTPASDLF